MTKVGSHDGRVSKPQLLNQAPPLCTFRWSCGGRRVNKCSVLRSHVRVGKPTMSMLNTYCIWRSNWRQRLHFLMNTFWNSIFKITIFQCTVPQFSSMSVWILFFFLPASSHKTKDAYTRMCDELLTCPIRHCVFILWQFSRGSS